MNLINYNGTNLTYNQLVQIFEDIAKHHGQINSFKEGQLYDFNAETVTNYPLMFLEAAPSKFTLNTIEYGLTVVIGDLVNPDVSNEREVLSDLIDVLWDVTFLLRDKYDLEPIFSIPVKPFVEYKNDRVSGWSATFTLSIPRTFGWCDTPFRNSFASGSTDYMGPYNLNCGDNCISNLFYEDSPSVSFVGNGSVCSPLIANVNLSATSGNTLHILDDGLYASGGTGVPSIPSTQIAFGSDSNALTSSPNLVWNGTDLVIAGGLNITDSESATLEFEDGGLFITAGSYLFELESFSGFFTTAPFTVTNDFTVEGGSFTLFGGNFIQEGGNMLLGTQTDNGNLLQMNGGNLHITNSVDNTAPNMITLVNNGNGVYTGGAILFPFGQLFSANYFFDGVTISNKAQDSFLQLGPYLFGFGGSATDGQGYIIDCPAEDAGLAINVANGTASNITMTVGGSYTFNLYNGSGYDDVVTISRSGIGLGTASTPLPITTYSTLKTAAGSTWDFGAVASGNATVIIDGVAYTIAVTPV